MSCHDCWAYKFLDFHDYCFLIGYDIKQKDIENTNPETCEELKNYEEYRKKGHF